jgi:hypothetical protein
MPQYIDFAEAFCTFKIWKNALYTSKRNFIDACTKFMAFPAPKLAMISIMCTTLVPNFTQIRKKCEKC